MAAILALAGALAIGEIAGWPFLAAPLQQGFSHLLDRRVQLSGGADFRVRVLGGLRLQAPQLEIAAPAWSAARTVRQGLSSYADLRLG